MTTRRDDALAEIDTHKAELANLPLPDFDIDQWLPTEAHRIQALGLAALMKEFQAAEKKDAEERKRLRTLGILRERFDIERKRFITFIRENETLVRGELLPANLAEAIRRAEDDIGAAEFLLNKKEAEAAKIEWQMSDTKNREQAGWTMQPPSTHFAGIITAANLKVSSVQSRLARLRDAARQLRALVMVSGDTIPAIRNILSELHAADLAADFATIDANPGTAAVSYPSVSNKTEAEIEA